MDHLFQLNENNTYLFYLFIGLIFIQFFFYFYFFSRIIFHKNKEKTEPPFKEKNLSLVILMNNAITQEIQHNISMFTRQEMEKNTKLEIIIPSYIRHETDTLDITNLQKNIPHKILLINLHQRPKYIGGEKYPISIAIKSAENNFILHTKSSCVPYSTQWAKHFFKAFQKGKEIILGYTKIKKTASFFNKFIRFENAHNHMLLFSFALAKIPLAGNGGNLGYTRNIFYKNKGFTHFNKILGGEDNLLTNQIANGQNTEILLDRNAFVQNNQPTNLKQWFYEKSIYLATMKYYKLHHLLLLMVYLSVQVCFVGTLTYFLLSPARTSIEILYLIIVRYTIQLILFGFILKRLEETDLIKWIPIMDFLLVLYYLRIVPNFFKNYKTYDE